MHEDDLGACPLRCGARHWRAGRNATPRAEGLLGELARLERVDRAGDHEQRLTRPHALAMERREIVAGDGSDAGFVGGAAVGMVAVEPLGERLTGDRRGLRLGERERRERLLAQQLDLGRGKRRAECRVGQELEGQPSVVAQHRRAHGEEVRSRRRVERTTYAFDGGRELLCRARTGALGEQPRDHLGSTRPSGRVIEGAAGHGERQREHRLLGIGDDEHPHAIGEHGLREGRELRRL